MYLTRITGFVLLSLSFSVMPAQAQKYGTQRGTVQFTSRVPLHTFTGTSDYLSGEIDLENRSVDFFVDLETLRTGIGRRDRDMRDALETDDYPFAEVLSPSGLSTDAKSVIRAMRSSLSAPAP